MPTTLRRSTLSRDEDYTLIWKEADGRELSVGRIFHAIAGVDPETPWFWGVEFHQAQGRSKPWYGYAADFEVAKEAWKRCWESAEVPIDWPPALKRPSA
jgi:hypothetical protein